MNRQITVRGTGRLSLKPDVVIISMQIDAHKLKYDETMNSAYEMIQGLKKAVYSAGIDGNELKTTNFNVNTSYENIRDDAGNYKRKFDGYVCSHSLKLEFGFEKDVLSKVLSELTSSSACPELAIKFSIKDREGACCKLLRETAKDAMKRAEILTNAAGVCIGELINIDYNYDELDFASPTNFAVRDISLCKASSVPDIEPDDIKISETALFSWEINSL